MRKPVLLEFSINKRRERNWNSLMSSAVFVFLRLHLVPEEMEANYKYNVSSLCCYAAKKTETNFIFFLK